MRSNVFVLGLDDFHLRQLNGLRTAESYRFHELYRKEDVKSGAEDVVRRVLAGARDKLATFPGRIDAIVGYWDFPVSTMLPILRRENGLPTPTLESVLKCEHKFWSRLEQARVVPKHVPTFCAVDPFDDASINSISVAFPFWIKPVKSVLSYLGFKVCNAEELNHAIAMIRAGIARIAVPFDDLLSYAQLPEEIAPINGRHCIVESIISQGRQCTLEGYVFDGKVTIYGAVDSVREGKHDSSFNRYQYPSTLSADVLARMTAIAERFLTRIGFDCSPFNIEFYWNEHTGQIWLLEINTRVSKSHAPLFKMVDGEFHHQVMLDLGLGQQPYFPSREGRYRVAAKFMWRAHHDAVVRRAPNAELLAQVRACFPGCDIELHVEPGMRLSDLSYQDSYSFELAAIFLGADDEAELLHRYTQCQQALGLELEQVG
jgi:hypothetical protein